MTADRVTYAFRHMSSITGRKGAAYSVAGFSKGLWEASYCNLNAFSLISQEKELRWNLGAVALIPISASLLV